MQARESFLRELVCGYGRQVDITLLADDPTTVGRTLSGIFVACDTNLTHILINDLRTPTGTQRSALLRLNDVISITYR